MAWTRETLSGLWVEVIADLKIRHPIYANCLRKTKCVAVVVDEKNSTFGWFSLKENKVSVNIHMHKCSDKVAVVDTMLHEIAHAINHHLIGGRGHDSKWKSVAKELGAIPLSRSKGSVKVSKKYVMCVHTDNVLFYGRGYNKKPPRTPINTPLLSTFFSECKEETLGNVIVYPWCKWCELCDKYGVSYYKEDHPKLVDVGWG